MTQVQDQELKLIFILIRVRYKCPSQITASKGMVSCVQAFCVRAVIATEVWIAKVRTHTGPEFRV
jgi:hypothetical protein